MPNSWLISINDGEKETPFFVSTSWVIIEQAVAPSGQNQIKGIGFSFANRMESASSFAKRRSTVVSIGHFGNDSRSHPFR